MHTLGLMVRCKNEPFLEEFCKYYKSQGVGVIHILDDDSDPKFYDTLKDLDYVHIHHGKDIVVHDSINALYSKIRHQMQWLMYVDADEYIVTKKHLDKIILWELEHTFADADCIKVPWVMMSFNGRKVNPKRLLHENTMRWNHDKRHPISFMRKMRSPKFRCRYGKIECKSIFRTNKFNSVSDHYPLSVERRRVVSGVSNHPVYLNPFIKNLREQDITEGYLLCYHYRIASIQDAQRKLDSNFWYQIDGYSMDLLVSTDYPEILDETLKNKSENLYK